jgi:PPM family protein phosphatase
VVQHLRPHGAMRTDTGMVRSLNEDSVAFVAPATGDPAASRGTLMLVADGMGGHAAGEVASALAVETVRRVFYELGGEVPQVLAAAFLAAHRAILSWAESNPECKGMGTTCTALAVREGQAWLAHIGDSRAYLLRAGVLTQLSDDQTLVAHMVREGKLTPEQAQNSPINNVILEALGAKEAIAPIVWADPLALSDGDILVLCSDGLSGVVPDATIADHIARLPPDQACGALIEAAKAAGAPDNVSVGVFRMTTDAEPQQRDQAEPQSGATRRLKVPREGSAAAESPPPVS